MAWWARVTEIAAPAVALLVACDQRRRSLSETVRGLGYSVVFDAPPLRLGPPQLAEVATDLWLLDMDEDSALVEWLLDHSNVPVLLGNDEIPAQRDEEYPRWQRRLLGKLSKFAGAPGGVPQLAAAVAPEPACCVWLLGASLGGPAAVKRFLDLLPDALPVAFVYAQHIDAGFEHQLPRILGRENGWRILNCEEGARLRPGDVLVAPISRALSFDPSGRIRLQEAGWSGAYQPDIGMLLDEVAGAFAPHCGAIIFSGMGEDGVDACGRLRRQGMQVWTQSAESSACATMPGAVQQAGHSCFQGSPEELALAMRQWLEQERPAAR